MTRQTSTEPKANQPADADPTPAEAKPSAKGDPAAKAGTGDAAAPAEASKAGDAPAAKGKRVMVTGGSGFVGRHVVRELLRRGHTPVCLVREPGRLLGSLPAAAQLRVETVSGTLSDRDALAQAASGADAVIHLVGIILETMRQSFRKVHVEGTQAVVSATRGAGVKRYVHMSALGTRPNAVAPYHRTKYEAEQIVRGSGLDWTIFQPSIIHGPDGEFMQLMKAFVKPKPQYGPLIAMPYFGSGEGKLQPVSVKDVAHVFVAALDTPASIGQTYGLGGPEVYSWKELYALCSEAIRGRVKRQMSVPIPIAKLLAVTVMKTPLVPKLLKFNRGQIAMAQEDSVCDRKPVEETFGIKLRPFREELFEYADMIA